MTEARNQDQQSVPDDPFDLAKLRLPQNYAEIGGGKQIITKVPVDKPGKHDYFRVHAEEGYHIETMVLELKEKEARETFIVAPELWAPLAHELVPKVLYTCVNRLGLVRIWPIKLPGDDGKLDDWNQSALIAAERAKSKWIRLISNRGLGAYEIREAPGKLGEPEWPDLSFEELLRLAFNDKFIGDINHPVLRRLRGES